MSDPIVKTIIDKLYKEEPEEEAIKDILLEWLDGNAITIKGKVYIFPHGRKHIRTLIKCMK